MQRPATSRSSVPTSSGAGSSRSRPSRSSSGAGATASSRSRSPGTYVTASPRRSTASSIAVTCPSSSGRRSCTPPSRGSCEVRPRRPVDAAPDAPPRSRPRRLGKALKTFYVKAYEDNLTGLSGMVAYNLLLSLFPLALLALFIASRVLQSGELETSVFKDLQRLFPSAAEDTITTALNNVKASSTGIGVVAVVTSVWFGSSFWGALDTAFCRIYHVECRTWLRQKRFSLVMLVVVLLFMAATVLIPTAQSILVSGTNGLPFGLKHVRGLVYAITLAFSLLILFAVLCVIYWAVPNERMPWRGI